MALLDMDEDLKILANKTVDKIYRKVKRAFSNELPSQVETIVDLAAEFPAPKRVKDNFHYFSFPMLDAAALNTEMMLNLLTALKGNNSNLYIHCDQGHGRSATVVAVVLVLKGFADSLVNAEQIIKSKRPKVNIHKEQMKSAKSILNEFYILNRKIH